jgi:predicted dehydrogenase
VAILRSASGVTSMIDSSCAGPVNLSPRTLIVGSEGVIETDADRRATVRRADGSSEELDPTPEGADVYLLPTQRWATMLRDAVRSGETPPGAPTFDDGLACAVVMDQLRQ